MIRGSPRNRQFIKTANAHRTGPAPRNSVIRTACWDRVLGTDTFRAGNARFLRGTASRGGLLSAGDRHFLDGEKAEKENPMVLQGRRGSFYSKNKGSVGDRQSVMVRAQSLSLDTELQTYR